MPSAHEAYWASDASEEGRKIPDWPDRHAELLLPYVLSYVEEEITTVLDVGAGNGRFLTVIEDLFPEAYRAAVEINPRAAKELEKGIAHYVHVGSFLDAEIQVQHDLVMAMGFLACVPEEDVEEAYARLDAVCGGCLLIRDYDAPTAAERPYGDSSIFQRDYGLEITTCCPGLELVLWTPEKAEGALQPSWWLFRRL